MGWYVAPCLNKLLSEIDSLAPARSKAADGSIGDTSHQARPSDHNPDWNAGGVVRARDITHDPTHGCDIHDLIRERMLRDPRIKYWITNRKIISYYAVGGYPPFAERPYHGSNTHERHGHGSCRSGRIYENDASPWLGEEEEMDEDTRKALADMRAEIKKEIEEEVAGLKTHLEQFGPVSKALFSVRRNPDGTLARRADGSIVYDETLEVLKDMVSEQNNTLGELADAVRKLSDDG